MVYQSPEIRQQRLSEHAQAVSAKFRKALAILTVYPARVRNELLEKVSAEYLQFRKATELAVSGSTVRVIQSSVCNEARSWVKGAVPKSIARYSFGQVSEDEAAERSSLANQQIRVCMAKRDTAVEVLTSLADFHNRDYSNEIKAVKRAFKRFNYAFNLYRLGVSWREISDLTHEPMQSRIEDKTLPAVITKYAGYPLSSSKQTVRCDKVNSLRASAQETFERAKARQLKLNPQAVDAQIKVWKKELEAFDLVLNLFAKGLDPASIHKLTGLPAHDWLRNKVLPVKVTRASLDLGSHRFTIPQQIDRDYSYIAGAIFASKRIFSRSRPIVFAAATRGKLDDFKELFERVFQSSLTNVRLESTKGGSTRFVVVAHHRRLLSGILDQLGIEERSTDPVPPFALLRDTKVRVPFIRGFLDFANLHLSIDRHHFQVAREDKPNLIKALGVALYLEGICPRVRTGESRGSLTVCDPDDFEKLYILAPGLFPSDFSAAPTEAIKEPIERIGEYLNYMRIKAVLNAYYANGERLDFKRILTLAGIPFNHTEPIPGHIKSRISNWHRGAIPDVAQRGAEMEQVFRELYGQYLRPRP